MQRLILLLVSCLVLSACNRSGTIDFDSNRSGTVEELFADAQNQRERRRYSDAAELFAEVERQYPLEPLAIEAQFARAATLYEGQLYGEAVAAFDRFLAFNPQHSRRLQATHLRALSFYEEIPDVFRDQSVTRQALLAFNDLIATYPSTQEARDAQAKLVLVRDQLAGHNMVIGRGYQQQNRFLAAQNRFKDVIETYPTTAQVPEAFFRLVETSLALGLEGEARRYGATLGFNFPSSRWYHQAYALLSR